MARKYSSLTQLEGVSTIRVGKLDILRLAPRI